MAHRALFPSRSGDPAEGRGGLVANAFIENVTSYDVEKKGRRFFLLWKGFYVRGGGASGCGAFSVFRRVLGVASGEAPGEMPRGGQ